MKSITVLAAAASASTGCRDPLLQPFASTSIWNTPIGSGAVLADDNGLLGNFVTNVFHNDTQYIIFNSSLDDPSLLHNRTTTVVTDLVEVIDQGWWGHTPLPAQKECPTANMSNQYCHCTVFGNRTGAGEKSTKLPPPLLFYFYLLSSSYHTLLNIMCSSECTGLFCSTSMLAHIRCPLIHV